MYTHRYTYTRVYLSIINVKQVKENNIQTKFKSIFVSYVTELELPGIGKNKRSNSGTFVDGRPSFAIQYSENS
jgi:hypothetical protein